MAPRPQDCLPCENRAERGQECLSPSGTSCPRRALAGQSPLPLPDLSRSPVLALGTNPELQGSL